MTTIKNIIFDLDGTLWDSRIQVLNAWKKVLPSKYTSNLSINLLNSLMGKTNDKYIEAIFGNISIKKAKKLMKLCESEEVEYLKEHGAKIYEHSIETIKKLYNNYNLFIVSNCQDGYIQSFLSFYKLEKYFEDFECNGRTNQSKTKNIELLINRNNLSTNETCYIGDTHTDYEAANNNNIEFIYANYGFGKMKYKKLQINNIQDVTVLIELINNRI